MKIAISGASGFVGKALAARLEGDGHEILRLVRRAPSAGEARWDPDKGEVDSGALEGCDAVVHLAGEGIASGRWNAEKKRRIRESRTKGTRALAEALAGLSSKPKVLISASAIGYYGDRGEEILDESAAASPDFLGKVCEEWEAAADPARAAGIRVVHPRIGIVLGTEGGALRKMLTPFKLGAGGKIGTGRQYMSWITLGDLVSVLVFAIENEALDGPVNAVAPNPVTNLEFTKTLGKVLGRPTLFPMPGFAAKLVFGEMAQSLLLGGARVKPALLESAGFAFGQSDLESALRDVLER